MEVARNEYNTIALALIQADRLTVHTHRVLSSYATQVDAIAIAIEEGRALRASWFTQMDRARGKVKLHELREARDLLATEQVCSLWIREQKSREARHRWAHPRRAAQSGSLVRRVRKAAKSIAEVRDLARSAGAESAQLSPPSCGDSTWAAGAFPWPHWLIGT